MHFLNHWKITFLQYFLNTKKNINYNLIVDFPILSFMKPTLFLSVEICDLILWKRKKDR